MIIQSCLADRENPHQMRRLRCLAAPQEPLRYRVAYTLGARSRCSARLFFYRLDRIQAYLVALTISQYLSIIITELSDSPRNVSVSSSTARPSSRSLKLMSPLGRRPLVYYARLSLVDYLSFITFYCYTLLGPFYGAIAIPSVTCCCCCCCRCRRCGHRFYIAIHQVSLLSHAACAIAIAGFGSSW